MLSSPSLAATRKMLRVFSTPNKASSAFKGALEIIIIEEPQLTYDKCIEHPDNSPSPKPADERKNAHSNIQRFHREDNITKKVSQDIIDYIHSYAEASAGYGFTNDQMPYVLLVVLTYFHYIFDAEANSSLERSISENLLICRSKVSAH